MPLLTISESAIESGFSVELLEALMKRCPKPGDDRVLAAKRMDDTIYIDDRELQGYLIYLREPWPLPAKGKAHGSRTRSRAMCARNAITRARSAGT